MHGQLGCSAALIFYESFRPKDLSTLMSLFSKRNCQLLAFFSGSLGALLSSNVLAVENTTSQSVSASSKPTATTSTLKDIAFPLSQKSSISSGFGMRADPFTGQYQNHAGIDLPAHFGSAILAASNGRVKFTGYLPRYGNLVEIDHGQGYITRYGHADRILVNVGDTVMASQMIATVGTTGRTTGPHLHFEVSHNQNTMDPRAFLSGEGVGFLNLPTLTPVASINRPMRYQIPQYTTYHVPKSNVTPTAYANKKAVSVSDEIKPRIIYVSKR